MCNLTDFNESPFVILSGYFSNIGQVSQVRFIYTYRYLILSNAPFTFMADEGNTDFAAVRSEENDDEFQPCPDYSVDTDTLKYLQNKGLHLVQTAYQEFLNRGLHSAGQGLKQIWNTYLAK